MEFDYEVVEKALNSKFKEIGEQLDDRVKTVEDQLHVLEQHAVDYSYDSHSFKAESIDTKGLDGFLKTGDRDFLEAKSMSIASDSSGGYTHIAELGPSIIDSVAEINPLMKEVNQVFISANVYDQIFTTTRSATGRAAESASRSETGTANFEKTSISLFDLYAYPKITNELLNSSQFKLDQWWRREVQEAFSETLATEFITGDGSSKSVGLLNSMSTAGLTTSPELAWGSLHYVDAGSPHVVSYALLLSVISALPVRYKAGGNAKWFMSTKAIEAVRGLVDQNGLPIWRQDFGIAGAPMVLLGYPVVEVPQLEGQSYPIMFGDMKQAYSFVSHMKGLGVLVDQITSPGFTKYFASLQCAGGVMDSRAMVALSATV
jgi:HK97 family phage major capsid protein